MRSSEIFREYIWLISAIWKAGKISLEDLSRDWERQSFSEGRPLARSTFNRHKSAIERIFGILIECDRSDGNRYYIVNTEELKGNSVANWMASMLSVNNILSENSAVQSRIMLEPVSTSVDTLQLAIDAMKENRSGLYLHYGSGNAEGNFLLGGAHGETEDYKFILSAVPGFTSFYTVKSYGGYMGKGEGGWRIVASSAATSSDKWVRLECVDGPDHRLSGLWQSSKYFNFDHFNNGDFVYANKNSAALFTFEPVELSGVEEALA